MKTIIKRLLPVILLIVCSASASLACTCVADSLGTRFRKASAVFIGRGIDLDVEPDPALVQGDGDQIVEVIKSWKGTKRKFISITFEQPRNFTCLTLFHLEPDKQYLVFAYGRHFEVVSVCSDTWVIPDDKDSLGYEQMHGFIRKLNSRWFRFKAKLSIR